MEFILEIMAVIIITALLFCLVFSGTIYRYRRCILCHKVAWFTFHPSFIKGGYGAYGVGKKRFYYNEECLGEAFDNPLKFEKELDWAFWIEECIEQKKLEDIEAFKVRSEKFEQAGKYRNAHP